jgi:hypothetical protein
MLFVCLLGFCIVLFLFLRQGLVIKLTILLPQSPELWDYRQQMSYLFVLLLLFLF